MQTRLTPVTNQYSSNGRSFKFQAKVEYWQEQLNAGRSIDDLAREQTEGKKNKSGCFIYYRNMIIDLLHTHELID